VRQIPAEQAFADPAGTGCPLVTGAAGATEGAKAGDAKAGDAKGDAKAGDEKK
jgi:hypothetical protein